MGRTRIPAGLGPAALLVSLGGVLLAWSWGRWLDPLIDFGRELYIPWRLAEGDALYSGLAYFNGPFSPHFNAAAFALFGVGLTTLVWVNVAVLAATAVMLDRLVRPVFGRLAAFLSVAVLLGAFAFSQLTRTGNYNFITPYSHEMTHGIALSLGALFALERACRTRGLSSTGIAGVLLGALFLTKVEFFAAAAVALGARLVLDARTGRGTAGSLAARMAALAGWAVIPVLGAWLWLRAGSSSWEATRGVLGPWRYLIGTGVGDLPFYREGLGWDDPAAHLGRMALAAAGWVVVFGGAAWAAVALRRSRGAGMAAGAAVAVVLAAGAATADRLPWSEIGRPLPVVLFLLTAWFSRRAWREGESVDERTRAAAAATLSIFSLVLLAKMVLHTRLHHYGFALAMPGVTFTAAVLAGEIPRLLEKRKGHAGFFRIVVAGAFLGLCVLHLRVSDKWYDSKTVTVGQGTDRFRAGPEGEALNRIVQALRQRARPGETLAMVPEGVMVNYLERRPNPTGFVTFLPPEFLMFGESRFLEGFRRHPPTWVVIAARDLREYGYVEIGQDIGGELMAWIGDRYAVEEEIEVPAIRDRSFGRSVLGRWDPVPPGAPGP